MSKFNPIKFSMALPDDVDLNDLLWDEPLTEEQKVKAERAWDEQRFGGLTVKEAKYMLQRHGATGAY